MAEQARKHFRPSVCSPVVISGFTDDTNTSHHRVEEVIVIVGDSSTGMAWA